MMGCVQNLAKTNSAKTLKCCWLLLLLLLRLLGAGKQQQIAKSPWNNQMGKKIKHANLEPKRAKQIGNRMEKQQKQNQH